MKYLQQYEDYRGPNKAMGFKHYNADVFAFVLETSEEGLNEFTEQSKNFSIYMKRLGF